MERIKPRIETSKPKILLGQHVEMNLLENRTQELWMSFGPKIQTIPNKKGDVRFSLQIYPRGYFESFNPTNQFTKWAAVEVTEEIEHTGLKTLTLEACDYAVFFYRGMPGDPSVFQYIYNEWLPKSGFTLSEKPHFEILSPKYKNGSPDSEEEIWIPIV